MAEKLERKVMEIYGENAATRDIIAYGSDIAGNIVETKDPDVIQTEAYKTGVRSAVVGNNSTTLQNRQALDFLFSRQLKYLYQHGVAEWSASETYFVNALAVGSNGNLYVSLTDNNKGSDPVTDTTNWQAFPTPAEVKDLIESYAAKKDLTNTNMITNCILSAPNGVMTICTPISEQLELSDDAVITDSQLTTGNAYFDTNLIKNGFDKSQNWLIKVTFKITSNKSDTLFMFRNHRHVWRKGSATYDYLDIFGTVKGTGDTLKFAFLRGFNDGYFYDSSAPSLTTPIQLNTEYTAIYDSSGSFVLSQGGTQIYHNSSTSYAFATLFPEAQNTGLYTANWKSNSGVTPINFNGTNLAYNSGVKTVPVVGDQYTLTVNKGLKVALANGYNADGTPKSEVVTLENDVTVTVPPNNANFLVNLILVRGDAGGFVVKTPAITDFQVVSSLPSSVPTRYTVFFNVTENKLYEYYNGSGGLNIYNKFVMLGSAQLTNGQFTQVFPYKPIQLSLEGRGDYVVESQVLSDGSWYRKYKSGWLEQGGLVATTSGAYGTVQTFIKPFDNANYTLTATARGTFDLTFLITSKTATTFSCAYSSSGIGAYDWCAEGQGA